MAVTEVIIDTNAVYQLPKALKLLKPGEVPVITRTIMAELRNNALHGTMRYPFAAAGLKVVEDASDVLTAIKVRGSIKALRPLKAVRGLFGDGRIGATAINTGRRVISADKDFIKALNQIRGGSGTLLH